MRYKILFYIAFISNMMLYSQQLKNETTIINEIENDSSVVSFEVIENVPIYSGCDNTMKNDDLRECMSTKISELISKNFDMNVGQKANIPSGMVRISVSYIINHDGDIENIIAKAAYPELEAEAIRVIKLIPRMRPGYQRGKPVSVPYTLPIMFNVEGKNKSEKKINYPVYRGCDDELGPEALKNCTTERIMDFIKVSIDMEIASKLFPLDKSTQFQADFVIDKKGKIKDIKVKAHRREMAVLAINTLKQLPKLKSPGTVEGTPSDVPLSFLMTLYFD